MRKIKVLFFIHDLSYGGAEKVLVNLVNNMDYSKFDITVQTIFDVGVNKESLSTKVRYIGGFPYMFRGNSYLFQLFSPKQLYNFFVREDYNVIISYLEGPCSRIISGCDKQEIKKISWIHIQLDDLKRYSKGFRSIKEANYCYNKFDKIIAVSKTVLDSFNKTAKDVNVPFEVLYNTNETTDIIFKSKEPIDDIQLDNNIINICSVAKITESKGFDHLAKVHKRLIEENFKHHIYILGVGEQKEEIQTYLKLNALEDTFTFLGFKKNPYKYMAKCDLYVCSSHREGFSTAVTESLIVGTPVISTQCSGANELLGYHNEYGLVVENSEEGLYQGIKKLLTNKNQLKKYKEIASERGKFFAKEKTVSAVEDMIFKLLDLTD